MMEVMKNKKFSIVFRCTVPKCSYSSKRLYNLQRHEKTHSKEHWRSKRFPCPCCAYAAATRAHLKRHMSKKHPTEDINKHTIKVLAYEDFEKPDEELNPDQESMEESMEQKRPTDQPKLTKDKLVESNQQQEKEQLIVGPVTVLQLVTPLSPQAKPRPGEMYCNVSLEGEAFRLIPVELLPAEVVKQNL
ncbi:hypothetical protein AWZ03_004457 [Drosophila navojoa]|uniref:C2H2-type domain-containing protein n=1 Tax=Drosophila navojoa TaxID=7232 RepID=A0A484BK43_DRONA|nr:RE1-silencing transcription factor-like [Drosophila navojoa]TDG49157.1 hypothetical protein AWZ03_004457 [Drosophila navojoa]